MLAGIGHYSKTTHALVMMLILKEISLFAMVAIPLII
jgi:hypothetical protein